MSSSADPTAYRYDGCSGEELARRLALPRVDVHERVTSTLDVAHAIASSAPPGTLVLADEQTAGRGTQGRRWRSARRVGVWLTLIERPRDPRTLDVLSLRCGLYAAEALDDLSVERIGVKWPNDLYVAGGKLAGVLIETRWRGATAEWVAIGFGLNVHAPDIDGAAGLAPAATRIGALERLVFALRAAAHADDLLSPDELARWAARDVARGRAISAPGAGVVGGISSAGELLVRRADGAISRHRSGSLTFAEPLACS